MRIERLELFSFPIPFKVVFRHASARRARAENLIVAAHSDCGQVGYGEGCPRAYVTGETVESGAAFIHQHADAIIDAVHDEGGLREWIGAHLTVIDQNPAAFCAVEIALLDLIGKIKRSPIERLVGVPALDGAFAYSAVLGDAPYLAYRWQFGRYWRQGFRDFKVKASGDLRRDRPKMRVFRNRSEPPPRVRLDANNLWTSAGECISHVEALPYPVFAIEEPLRKGDLEGFDRVGQACRIKVILDESVSQTRQLDALGAGDRWIVNLRVSKMGGIIRSLELAANAARYGIGVIVGAQVGETSILTRAALTVMNAIRSNLVACEGAFGTHLLQQDLTTESIMFRAGGTLSADDLGTNRDPGLGLKIRERALIPVRFRPL